MFTASEQQPKHPKKGTDNNQSAPNGMELNITPFFLVTVKYTVFQY